MRAGLLWLVQGLRLGAEGGALAQALRSLRDGQHAPLRVRAVSGYLARPLRKAGCEVLGPDDLASTLPDVIGAATFEGDLVQALGRWAEQVRPGGLVMLVTRRGQLSRESLCAAFLHAGLRELSQRKTGLAVITTGVAGTPARPQPETPERREQKEQKTCDVLPDVRIEQGGYPT